MTWRKEYKPDVLSDEEAAPYLSKGVLARCGPDKYGHPCLYAASRNHFIDAENHDANLRTIVHMLDATKRDATEKGNGFIAVIIDQDQCGRKNMDTHLFIGRPGLVHILQVRACVRCLIIDYTIASSRTCLRVYFCCHPPLDDHDLMILNTTVAASSHHLEPKPKQTQTSGLLPRDAGGRLHHAHLLALPRRVGHHLPLPRREDAQQGQGPRKVRDNQLTGSGSVCLPACLPV